MRFQAPKRRAEVGGRIIVFSRAWQSRGYQVLIFIFPLHYCNDVNISFFASTPQHPSK